ncbi:hypothetical protein GCM10010251_93830 [Streptomyces aurantiogriseus]|uniref:Uncharacterized protein n=1 Tax=Streptomyces aurantiogriseus TaxID=66870 RepID=A0A918L013_9ACTN|nr:hypothetical protein GCM10010251_93830 [Streptomyces aurantiogriseus]
MRTTQQTLRLRSAARAAERQQLALSLRPRYESGATVPELAQECSYSVATQAQVKTGRCRGERPPGRIRVGSAFVHHERALPGPLQRCAAPELLQQAVAGAVADEVLERFGDALWAPARRWSRIPVASPSL